MNNRVAKELRRQAKKIALQAEASTHTSYVMVDPNLSDNPMFAGESTGQKDTHTVDQTCVRGIYLSLKKHYKTNQVKTINV